ncbi:MAG TPA: hypothetical protein VGJ13_16070 [Pseudonocardiaceae bacterium]
MAVEHVQPDITRPDAGLALVSVWTVGAPDRQRAAMDAAADGFQRLGLPDGFLSLHFLISPESDTTLLYAQLTGEDAYYAFLRRDDRPTLKRGVDEVSAVSSATAWTPTGSTAATAAASGRAPPGASWRSRSPSTAPARPRRGPSVCWPGCARPVRSPG